MTGLFQDLRYAARQLRKSPGFTCVAIVTLVLGIGANTAIFTLLDQALLRRVPVKEPDRLVVLRYSGTDLLGGYSTTRTNDKLYFSYPVYRDLRDRSTSLGGVVATTWAHVGIEWHKQPELVDAELVSGNYFDTLGVKPALGRLLVPSDDVVENGNPVAVLSFDYWQRRFGLDPKIVNQNISINGHPFVVIGAAQPGFHSVVGGDTPSIFAPMTMKPEITPGWNDLEQPRSKWLNIVGRLNPGITRAHAQAEMDSVWRSIRTDELKLLGRHTSASDKQAFVYNSHLFLDDGSKGVPLHGSLPTTLLAVMGMAGLTALMACTNVSSLLLVRVASRTREISVRYALGAGRSRLIRQLLSEGALLGFLGGCGGILMAPRISPVLMRILWARPDGGVNLSFSPQPDFNILAFNFALALIVTLLFSLAPIVQFWRPDVTPALKQQSATVSGGSLILRKLSVVAQIGLSFVLLLGACLFVRSLHNLKNVDVGFPTDHLLTFRINPALAGYDGDQVLPLYRHVLEKLSSLPGVSSAAATGDPEVANTNNTSNITIAGYHPADHEDMNVEWEWVSSRYLSTMKTPFIAGRDIEEQDRAETHKVAVVNESFAKRFFRTPESAIGQYFCAGAGSVTPDTEIVGVVKDIKHTSMRDRVRQIVFTPYAQVTKDGLVAVRQGMTFYVRTWQAPKSAESTVRAGMQVLDSRLVLDRFETMNEQIDDSLIDERLIAFLATIFGGLAALMAAIGTYGVLAYAIAQRTREIGIRIAIGASKAEVVHLIFKEVLWLSIAGIGAGVPSSIVLARAIREQLYGVSNHDLPTLVIACLAIGSVAFVSALLPARRASKVDPIVALRYE